MILDGETITILCNMSAETAKIQNAYSGKCILGNMSSCYEMDTLAPYEARVLQFIEQ